MDITQHIPMVRRIAAKLARKLPSHVEFDDLVQAGCLGLVDAAQRYDPSKGASFSTFGARRAYGAMLDELRSSDMLSRQMRQQMPDFVVHEQLRLTGEFNAHHRKLAAPSPEEPDLIGQRWLRRAVKQLPVRHSIVLLSSYKKNVASAGARFGIKATRVCQLRAEACDRLRQLAGATS